VAGEAKEPPLRPTFDRRIKLGFHGAKLTSDGGLLAYRELDDALGLTDTAITKLLYGRLGKNTRHKLRGGLFRQAVFGRLAGYEDVNDAERLARDPAMCAIVGRDGFDRAAASSSQIGRFETEWLATDANLAALTDLSGTWIDRVHARKPPQRIILDRDSSESLTHGEEGSAWNGHFGCTCYHPLFLFNQFGDLECCRLRPGNVHSAEDWRLVLEPVVARYHERGLDLYFRADAAFATPEVYERLEAANIHYAIRLPANQVLQRRISYLLTRPVGRPPKQPIVCYASFHYQAAGWDAPVLPCLPAQRGAAPASRARLQPR
jgi:hypothetical protein